MFVPHPDDMDALQNAAYAVQHDPVRHHLESDSRRAASRLWKIIMLSPTLDILEALCRNEPVPIERLDPEWVKRFGLRDQEAA